MAAPKKNTTLNTDDQTAEAIAETINGIMNIVNGGKMVTRGLGGSVKERLQKRLQKKTEKLTKRIEKNMSAEARELEDTRQKIRNLKHFERSQGVYKTASDIGVQARAAGNLLKNMWRGIRGDISLEQEAGEQTDGNKSK
jgi:hypothetical protein